MPFIETSVEQDGNELAVTVWVTHPGIKGSELTSAAEYIGKMITGLAETTLLPKVSLVDDVGSTRLKEHERRLIDRNSDLRTTIELVLRPGRAYLRPPLEVLLNQFAGAVCMPISSDVSKCVLDNLPWPAADRYAGVSLLTYRLPKRLVARTA